MSDGAGACAGVCCTFCCLGGEAGLATWCNTQTFGAGGCPCCRNHVNGCCGSCCNDSFDEDAFDKKVRKDLENTRDPNAPADSSALQLAPSGDMKVPQSSPGK
ncbi:uncharacterized protein LACBIDRAFT_317006 [Laccaria bicolor S238N-H82]|uniref:Predicted protein n=1 Tax=Laccaria bicolor (strain S238N-H82 / ATCC MYA-4686) TaxID=486041 RepID=B0D464_LACBS|nr:uncharacterized protein LACBIDRAFT_317006 [Laccaria bicolor S238N-H82]EDR10278.1 predicted protein [Laccaria bicolor S238N-H82]|eukprot:XP_001878728.1 predicted protein [Laccaria bicolor S238N-H82]